MVDEAQEISEEQQGSFLPMLAASKRPQTIYVGTPPDENAPGTVFTRLRDNARSGKSTELCWSEWSVDEIGDTSDRDRWADTNPSLGYLIKESSVAAECEQLDAETFARERLGFWKKRKKSDDKLIARETWQSCATDDPPDSGAETYAVKIASDGSVATIAACRKQESCMPHVEAVMTVGLGNGLQPIVDWLSERKDRAYRIVVDGVAFAKPLMDKLHREGVSKRKMVRPSSSEVVDACTTFLAAVNECGLTHANQPELNNAIDNSVKRSIGRNGGWGFGGPDYTLPESCALALRWGMEASIRPTRKARIG